MTKAFLPSDFNRRDALVPWQRFITAQAIARGAGNRGTYPDAVIARLWGKDTRAAEEIRKAAVQPTTTDSATSQPAVGAFLQSLRPRSAAVQLFTNPISLAGTTEVRLPRLATDWPEPTFVVEGGPIPAVQGSFTSTTLGPPAKLAMMVGITGELERYSAEAATAIVTEASQDAAARALDAAVFSATAASAARPAGLLNGVTAITADSGSGVTAMVADVQALVGAIGTAGGGSSVVVFANPVQAVALNALASNGIGYPVIPAPSLAIGTVIAVEANAIASGFTGLPQIDASREAIIHFEDADPEQIGTPDTTNTVAAPVRSAFQQDLIILRLILPCAWTPRAPGMVQYMTGVNW